MISKLEKLLLGITAALAFSCGEEATEQCREGREWNGSECVPVSDDYGRDAGNDTTVEELGPECYTHTECGDGYLCVEGSCESIEEACRIDESAGCNESTRFDGVYEIVSSNCDLIFDLINGSLGYIGFYSTRDDCDSPGIAGFITPSSEPVCIQYAEEPDGNLLRLNFENNLTPGISLEFIKCSPTTILFKWNEGDCEAIFELYQRDYFNALCYED